MKGDKGDKGDQGERGYPATVNGVTADSNGNIVITPEIIGAETIGHAAKHAKGGTDAITPASIGAQVDLGVASVSALATALGVGSGLKIAVGSYTGSYTLTTKTESTISLSFTPKAVLVVSQNGLVYENVSNGGERAYIGLAVTGIGADDGSYEGVKIQTNGFSVRNSGYRIYMNSSGRKYNYIAIG